MENRKNCPYCVVQGLSPDTGGHLYINDIKHCCHCKRCGYSGVAPSGTLPPFASFHSSADFSKVGLYSFNTRKLRELSIEAKKVYQYGLSRLSEHTVVERTRYSPDVPTRLFFPISDEPSTWQARSILPGFKPKYITCGKKSEFIYNLDHVEEWAVLLEGPINALSCPHGISIMGKSLSGTQLLTITHKFDTIYVAMDFGAEKAQDKIIDQLLPFTEVKLIYFEDERDANDLGWNIMIDKIRNAQNAE